MLLLGWDEELLVSIFVKQEEPCQPQRFQKPGCVCRAGGSPGHARHPVPPDPTHPGAVGGHRGALLMALTPLGSGWALCCTSGPAVSVGVVVLLLQQNVGEL